MRMKTHDSTGKRAKPFWSEEVYASEDGTQEWGLFVTYHPDGKEDEFLWPWEPGYITPCDQRLKQFSEEAESRTHSYSPGLPSDAKSSRKRP